jgi:CheY-like chemotaxis protein
MSTKYWSRILIVEDEGITAQALREALEEMNCEVVDVVTSGWESVEKARELEPDLVLMDIQLKGGMDGISATQRIQTQLNIPVVYLTAFSDSDTLKRVLHSGAYGYVVKPFDPDELQSVISQAIRQHRLRRP